MSFHTAKPRVIVAEADDKIRAATCEILRREAYDVTPCNAGDEVLALCKRLNPAALFVDVTLDGLDATELVRILQRCRGVTPVRMIAVCPIGFEEYRRALLKTHGAFAVLQRPLKRATIIATAGAALASWTEQQAALDATTAKRPARARTIATNNALLARKVLCPFHEEPVAFDRYTLRTGKVFTDTNFFDMPVYGAAAPGADGVNFHAVSTMVCPRCLFASNHAGYFQDALETAALPFPFSEAAAHAIRRGAAARARYAGTLPANFFTSERSLEAALVAVGLSIECSRTLLGSNAHTFNLERARIGNAHLRRAHLMESLSRPAAEIDAEYRGASETLSQAFSALRNEAIYRVAYQVMALAIRFNDDGTAFQYLRLMLELERDSTLLTEDRAALNRYLPRCQRAWEDRGTHRGPAVPWAA